MDDEQQRRWQAHCARMAEATYAIADWCEDPDMMDAYVALGAQWLQLATKGPPARIEAPGIMPAKDKAA
jgi:hypothetical protein